MRASRDFVECRWWLWMLITRLGGGDSVEGLEVVDEVAVGLEELDVRTVLLELAGVLQVEVLLAAERGETPALRDDDLLLAGELVTGTAESLHDDGLVGILASDGKDDLANVDTGDHTVGLTPGASHSGLESIGTGAGQLLVLVRDEVAAEGELIDRGTLAAKVEDTDLWVRDTSVEPRLGERLVLAVAVALRRAATHDVFFLWCRGCVLCLRLVDVAFDGSH